MYELSKPNQLYEFLLLIILLGIVGAGPAGCSLIVRAIRLGF